LIELGAERGERGAEGAEEAVDSLEGEGEGGVRGHCVFGRRVRGGDWRVWVDGPSE